MAVTKRLPATVRRTGKRQLSIEFDDFEAALLEQHRQRWRLRSWGQVVRRLVGQLGRGMTLTIPEESGRCRWCSCTYDRPCASGCGWANSTQTLCTACVNFDRLIRSARGRAELLDKLQDAEIV